MGNDIKIYVDSCEPCQRTKTRRRKVGQLHPHDIPSQPWEVISMDLIGPLPESQGFNAIQVWVDTKTKSIHAEATVMETSSEGMAKLTRDRVIRYHGLPKKIISDRDPRYVSKFTRELYRLLGVEQNPSTAYHPQTDGQTERMNQEIEKYLRIYVNYHQDDWAEWLALAEFSYNDKMNDSTKMSPFFADHGYHPWKGTEPRLQSNNESALGFATRMRTIQEEAEAALRKSKELMKKYYDKNKKLSKEYQAGDKVWIEDLDTDRPTKKLADKRVGPYEVVSKIGQAAYKCHLPGSSHLHPVFHESRLTPYIEPPPHRQEERPPPEIIGNAPEYEVEEVLGKRRVGRGWQFLVKWKGYPNADNTWEPQRNLENAKDAVADFKNRELPIFPAGYWDQEIHRFDNNRPQTTIFDPLYRNGGQVCLLFNPYKGVKGKFNVVKNPILNR